jgi:hypothetical protein
MAQKQCSGWLVCRRYIWVGGGMVGFRGWLQTMFKTPSCDTESVQGGNPEGILKLTGEVT